MASPPAGRALPGEVVERQRHSTARGPRALVDPFARTSRTRLVSPRRQRCSSLRCISGDSSVPLRGDARPPSDRQNSSLGNSCLYELTNECRRQASGRGESNGSSARVVSGEICLECCNRLAAHWVKGTVICSGFEAGNQLPVQPERGHPVTDALLRARCCSMDSATHLLERCAVFWGQAGQIFVNGLRLQ